MNGTINVAIDGPSGAGKSTVARLTAGKLGYVYVDTGAMYRALALACLRKGFAPEDETNIVKTCQKSDVTITYDGGEQVVLLDGENVNSLIRSEEVSRMTSPVSAYPKVREKLLLLQRNLAAEHNVIMDGRDIGTVVLPDADVKIYLTASSAVRAERRYKELTEKGAVCDLKKIEEDIKIRDYQDMNREISPLKQAEDAVLVDSSDMTIDQVIEEIISIVEKKRSNG